MNDKICVELLVPYLEKSYNILIPKNQQLKMILGSLNELLNETSYRYFPITNELSLIDSLTGNVFDINKTAQENDILNNSILILM